MPRRIGGAPCLTVCRMAATTGAPPRARHRRNSRRESLTGLSENDDIVRRALLSLVRTSTPTPRLGWTSSNASVTDAGGPAGGGRPRPPRRRERRHRGRRVVGVLRPKPGIAIPPPTGRPRSRGPASRRRSSSSGPSSAGSPSASSSSSASPRPRHPRPGLRLVRGVLRRHPGKRALGGHAEGALDPADRQGGRRCSGAGGAVGDAIPRPGWEIMQSRAAYAPGTPVTAQDVTVDARRDRWRSR